MVRLLHQYLQKRIMRVIKKGKSMADYKIICPKCFATVLTSHPEAMIWELCPACRRHVWEAPDLMMAEVVNANRVAIVKTM